MSDEPSETPERRTARLLRQQAKACGAMGSPMYDVLLRAAADDLLAGGPTSRVLDGHLRDPGPSALALRMMGGVHAFVLSGRAPGLARYYPSVTPSAEIAGPATDAWPAVAEILDTHCDEVRGWLERPPQTNEVGRGAALVGGLRHIVAEAPLPIRLIEIGASAGLNLYADAFRIDGDAGEYGDPASPVQLGAAWLGVPPPAGRIEIANRCGADVDPVDVSTDEGRLLLAAYVWPDQVGRLERLRGAFELATASPVTVNRQSADDTLRDTELVAGSWTVVWHSVFQQYLPSQVRDDDRTEIRRLGEAATEHRRFAHLSLEPKRRVSLEPKRRVSLEPKRRVSLERKRRGNSSAAFEFLVTLTTWPGGNRRVLGTASPHGIPTTWDR